MPDGDTISVILPTEVVNELRGLVAAGEYASESDAIRDAVMLWRGQRANDELFGNIRARIQESLNDPHPSLSMDEIDAWIRTLPGDEEPLPGDAAR